MSIRPKSYNSAEKKKPNKIDFEKEDLLIKEKDRMDDSKVLLKSESNDKYGKTVNRICVDEKNGIGFDRSRSRERKIKKNIDKIFLSEDEINFLNKIDFPDIINMDKDDIKEYKENLKLSLYSFIDTMEEERVHSMRFNKINFHDNDIVQSNKNNSSIKNIKIDNIKFENENPQKFLRKNSRNVLEERSCTSLKSINNYVMKNWKNSLISKNISLPQDLTKIFNFLEINPSIDLISLSYNRNKKNTNVKVKRLLSLYDNKNDNRNDNNNDDNKKINNDDNDNNNNNNRFNNDDNNTIKLVEDLQEKFKYLKQIPQLRPKSYRKSIIAVRTLQ